MNPIEIKDKTKKFSAGWKGSAKFLIVIVTWLIWLLAFLYIAITDPTFIHIFNKWSHNFYLNEFIVFFLGFTFPLLIGCILFGLLEWHRWHLSVIVLLPAIVLYLWGAFAFLFEWYEPMPIRENLFMVMGLIISFYGAYLGSVVGRKRLERQ